MPGFRETLRYFYTTPPAEAVLHLRRRLGLIDPDRAYRAAILHSRAALRVQKLIDFLHRYEAILARSAGWPALDFAGKDVLELGAGPLLGWGPLALFCGARRFVALDPGWRPGVLDDPAIRQAFFRPLHADLSAVYGPRMSFESLMQALRERAAAHAVPAHRSPDAGPFDIVLSNSCLEHVSPFDATVAWLARVAAPGGRFLHLVDFGNHRATPGPFDGIYDRSPEAFFRRRRDLNLLRAPDMLDAFERAGLPTRMVPYACVEEAEIEPVHPNWRARYGSDALAIRTAILASRE